MTLTTKYDIGDLVYYINSNGKVTESRVYRLDIKVNNSLTDNYALGSISVVYALSDTSASEDRIYSTKEAAAKAWLEKQGLSCGVVG